MKRFKVEFLVLMLSCVLAGTACAQQVQGKTPTSPEQLAEVMQSFTNSQTAAAVASARPLANAMIDAQVEAGARPETAERIAEFKRNLFNALKAKGFTEAQAMQIVIATPLPVPVSAR